RGRRRPSRRAPARRAARTESRRRPAAKRDRDLATGRHRYAVAEYLEATRLDLREQREIDPSHDLGRDERTRVHRRKARLRRPIEPPRPVRLMAHELHELLGVPAGLEILDGHAELPQIVLRQVDPPAARVGADIADDVRELERRAHVDRVLARPRIGVAEDLDTAEPDRRG